MIIWLDLLYILEQASIIELSRIQRNLCFYIPLGLMMAHGLKSRAALSRSKVGQSAIVQYAFLATVIAIIGLIKSQAIEDTFIDELFRLAFAHSISDYGLPTLNSWWIHEARGSVSYYLLTEYIAVSIIPFFVDTEGLSTFYLQWYRSIIAFISCVLLFDFYKRKTESMTTGETRLETAISFMVLFLIATLVSVGISPYTQGLAHSLFRQNSLALMASIIAVLLLIEFEDEHHKAGNSVFYLACLLPGAVANLKILYVPVIALLLLFFSIRFLAKGIVSYTTVLIGGFASLAFIFINIHFNGTLDSAQSLSGGSLYIDLFVTLKTLRNGWIVPFSSEWISASLLVFVIPSALLMTLTLSNRKKDNRSALTAAFWITLAASAISIAMGTSVKFSANTGDAESYFIIAGWSFLCVAAVLALTLKSHELSKRTGFAILLFLMGLSTVNLLYIYIDIKDRIKYSYGPVFQICETIHSNKDIIEPYRNSVRIAHPWNESRIAYGFNGFCGLKSFTIPGIDDPYASSIKNSADHVKTLDMMRKITGSPQGNLNALLNELNINIPLIIVRDKSISNDSISAGCRALPESEKHSIFLCVPPA